jgi:gluconokinase
MIVIVMGVVGSGKTTVGRLLADQLGWEFADADDFHPAANIEKIHRGIPLTDQDREPWLAALHTMISGRITADRSLVLACSALKVSYRRTLGVEPAVRFVYLKGESALIAERLHARQGHFADERILASQLADLEEPQDAVTVDIAGTPPQIVHKIRKALDLE